AEPVLEKRYERWLGARGADVGLSSIPGGAALTHEQVRRREHRARRGFEIAAPGLGARGQQLENRGLSVDVEEDAGAKVPFRVHGAEPRGLGRQDFFAEASG